MIKAVEIHAFSTTHMVAFGISSECEEVWSENDVVFGGCVGFDHTVVSCPKS
jgi:hypothetical protein